MRNIKKYANAAQKALKKKLFILCFSLYANYACEANSVLIKYFYFE